MILRPLCTSVDLRDAIAFGKGLYDTVSKGDRPRVVTEPFSGGTDLLLIRIVLSLNPEADQVQILSAPKPQWFIFVSNQWGTAGKSTVPFYGPNAASPHISTDIATGETGTIIVIGPVLGTPFTLTSSDTGVCTVADRPTTFAEAASMGTLPADLTADNCTVSGFTLTVDSYGSTKFYLERAAVGGYNALPSQFGGEHIFRRPPLPGVITFFSTGGFVIGGAAEVTTSDHYRHHSEGGFVIGGSAWVTYKKVCHTSGGFVFGGAARVEMVRRPTAQHIGPFTLTWAQRSNYHFPLAGKDHNGNPLSTFRITMTGPLFASLDNSGVGTLSIPGSTSFVYVAVEGTTESLPVVVDVTLQVPTYPPVAVNQTVSFTYQQAVINSATLQLRGTPVSGGTITQYRIDSVATGLYVALGSNGLVTVDASDAGSYLIQFAVLEHSAGGDLWSTFDGVVTVIVAQAVCPQAAFTISAVNGDRVGVTWALRNTTPVPDDGGSLTLFWEVLYRPYNSAAPIRPDASSSTVTFTPDVDGSYTFQLTVTDSHGQSTIKVATVGVLPALVPPEGVTYSMNVDAAQIVGATYTVTMSGIAKRGGTLTYHWYVRYPNMAVYRDGGASASRLASFSVPYVGTWYLTYYVTETANGVAATSAGATVTLYISAMTRLIPSITISPSTIQVRQTGSITVTPDSRGGDWDITIGGSGSTGSLTSDTLRGAGSGGTARGVVTGTLAGQVLVTVHQSGGATYLDGYSSVWVAVVEAPQWRRIWTSPKKDIRTYPTFNSYLVTLVINGYCRVVRQPVDRFEFLSEDGQWKIVGDYFGADDYNALHAGYGTDLFYLDEGLAASGLNYNFVTIYGDGTWTTAFTAPYYVTGCGETFWVRELWQKS